MNVITFDFLFLKKSAKTLQYMDIAMILQKRSGMDLFTTTLMAPTPVKSPI